MELSGFRMHYRCEVAPLQLLARFIVLLTVHKTSLLIVVLIVLLNEQIMRDITCLCPPFFSKFQDLELKCQIDLMSKDPGILNANALKTDRSTGALCSRAVVMYNKMPEANKLSSCIPKNISP